MLTSIGACTTNPGTRDMSANSGSIDGGQNKVPDMKLREAWEDKIKGLNKQLKDYPLQKINAFDSLLAQVTEEEVKNEFEKIAQSPVGYSDLDEYQKTFVQVLIMRKVKERDRAALVALFSSKAPEFYGGEPIAIYLSDSGIPDPLLVLFDSYDRTTNADTKRDLLAILGHAFRNLREKLTGDEFVIQSRTWYLQNHAKLEVNPYYHPDSLFPDQQELFVKKPNRQGN
jgi:hypothetical protein